MTIDQLLNLPAYSPAGSYDPYVVVNGMAIHPAGFYDFTMHFMLLFLILQFVFPWALTKEKRFTKNRLLTVFRNTVVAIMAYWIFVSICWGLFLVFRHFDLHSLALFERWQLSPLSRIAIGILAMDFSLFVLHFAMHKVPQLWPVHRVHHVEYYVDAFTWPKLHPIEGVINASLVFFATYLTGCTAFELLIMLNTGKFFAIFLHSDWRLPWWVEKHIGKIFMTSGHHLSHHDQDENYHHANFGLIFTFWDRVFKSYRPPEKDRRYNYGLPGYDGQKTTVWQILALKPAKLPTK